jgi:Ca2+/H+ antiporter
VLVGIAASKFSFSTVANVFDFSRATEEVTALQMFIIGMSFLYLAVNLWYVVELIPLPGKHQSLSDRLAEVEKDMEILADDDDDEQVRWWKTVLLLAVTVSVLAANYFVNFVSDETLVPLFIVLLPVVDKFKLPAKTHP